MAKVLAFVLACILLLPSFSCAETAAPQPRPQVGDLISFGHYEQDNDKANGSEEIQWRVLAVEDGKALLISKEPGRQRYNLQKVTRQPVPAKWLNNFLNSAFNEDERDRILLTTLKNDNNPSPHQWEGGSETQDQVFLLSIEEANYTFD